MGKPQKLTKKPFTMSDSISLHITIPKALVQVCGVTTDTDFEIRIEKNKVVLRQT